MQNNGFLDRQQDIFDLLKKWVDKNIKNGNIQPKIFIRDGIAYRFTVKSGDMEFSYEVGDKV